MASSKENALHHSEYFKEPWLHCKLQKPVLTPINNMKFLGFNLNTMDMLILPPQEDQVGGPDDTRPEESHSMAIDKNGGSPKLLHSCSDSGSPVLSKFSEDN